MSKALLLLCLLVACLCVGCTAPPLLSMAQRTPTTKPVRCQVRGPLPDSLCTPGTIFPAVTLKQVCTPGYASSVRNVPASEKAAVYKEYGVTHHTAGQYEVDHLVSLELGGSNALANLWPEAASPTPGFHEKDMVENDLHVKVCSGKMMLREAQREIASNWLKVYQAGM